MDSSLVRNRTFKRGEKSIIFRDAWSKIQSRIWENLMIRILKGILRRKQRKNPLRKLFISDLINDLVYFHVFSPKKFLLWKRKMHLGNKDRNWKLFDKRCERHRWWLQWIRQVLATLDTIEWISFWSTGTPPLTRFFPFPKKRVKGKPL